MFHYIWFIRLFLSLQCALFPQLSIFNSSHTEQLPQNTVFKKDTISQCIAIYSFLQPSPNNSFTLFSEQFTTVWISKACGYLVLYNLLQLPKISEILRENIHILSSTIWRNRVRGSEYMFTHDYIIMTSKHVFYTKID